MRTHVFILDSFYFVDSVENHVSDSLVGCVRGMFRVVYRGTKRGLCAVYLHPCSTEFVANLRRGCLLSGLCVNRACARVCSVWVVAMVGWRGVILCGRGTVDLTCRGVGWCVPWPVLAATQAHAIRCVLVADEKDGWCQLRFPIPARCGSHVASADGDGGRVEVGRTSPERFRRDGSIAERQCNNDRCGSGGDGGWMGWIIQASLQHTSTCVCVCVVALIMPPLLTHVYTRVDDGVV